MLKNLCALLLIFIFAAPLVAQQTAAAQPNEVLVKFRATANTASVLSVASQEDISESRPVGGAGAVRLHSRSKDSATLIQHLKANPDVEYVEPNYILHTTATPNDLDYIQLWGMPVIGAPAAWDISTGSAGVVVGVVDTGIDYTHPDLATNIWSAPTAFTVNIGRTLVTCPAGTHGFNALTFTCDPMDDNDHGTHVSGTIGAVGNNGFGVVGVNWATSIMGMKSFDSAGFGATSDIINAIEFAIQTKAAFGASANVRVLNNSYGCQGCLSQAFQGEINKAYDNNILFVAAAGNNGTKNDQTPSYPANYQNVVAVAAIDSSGNRASFSNYGPNTVPLAAPGVNIFSTLRENRYGSMDGTSMATPHVSGSAALILSACGSLGTNALRNQILSNAVMTPAVDGVVQNGVLNVNNAIQPCVRPPISVTVAPASATLLVGQTQQFTATVSNAVNPAVTWSVVGAGTITQSGLYTAPSSVPGQPVDVYEVKATSIEDQTKSGSAPVQVWNKPTCTLAVTPSTIAYGSSFTLSWTTANATQAIVSYLGPMAPVSGGSAVINGLGKTTTYTMTASNPAGGSPPCSATVTVCKSAVLPNGQCQ